MNLSIDIGNSSAKMAVFEKDRLIEVFHSNNHSLDALPAILQNYPIEKGILSSVITLSPTLEAQIDELPFQMVRFDYKTPLPINNRYATPETLGCDRLAAVIGAYTLYPKHNILCIDIGSAITFDVIDAGGNYLGGNISPGVQMRLKALHHYTDKLPLVSPEGETETIATTTESAIRSGVKLGIVNEINGYISNMKAKYPELLIYLTGGDEFSFESTIKSSIFADKFLVLKGLNSILLHNDV